MKFRFINTNLNTATYNMALDETILHFVSKGISKPTLRFYSWLKPSLSIGYFQNSKKSIDIENCKRLNIQIIRRLTGGRAVLHSNELTYSICVPNTCKLFPSTINESYKFISLALIKGLDILSIQADFAPEISTKITGYSGACFDAPSNYEITVNNKKIIGSAQTRQKEALLQHGSILNYSNLNLLTNCMNFSNEKMRNRFKSIMVSKSTSLQEILGQTVDYEIQSKAFLEGFENKLDLEFSFEILSKEEIEMAKDLEHKYLDDKWTFKR